MKKKRYGKGREQDIVCKKDDILDLDILNIGNDGEGIGRFDGYTLFVKDALAGDRVRVKVMKTKKHFGYAKLLKVLKPSKDRVEPACPVAARCGGCQLQHCKYERQLAYKEEKVRDCLERIGGFNVIPSGVETVLEGEDGSGGEHGAGKESVSGGGCGEHAMEKESVLGGECSEHGARKESVLGGECSEHGARKESVLVGGYGNAVRMEPILGMENPYHYRNKAQFPVGVDKQGNLVAGFYAGRTHQIIPNTDCMIQHPCNHRILETILAFMREYQIPVYDETAHTGLVRHILTRVGVKTGEVMVCLVVNGERLPHTDRLLERLLSLRFEAGTDIHDLKAAKKEQDIDISVLKKDGEEQDVEIFTLKAEGENPDTDISTLKAEGVKKDEEFFVRRTKGRTGQLPALRIASVCLNHNMEKTNVILGDRISVLYGRSYIEDFIGDIKFQISPLSFYQVNPLQTEKLYRTALEYAGLSGGETVWDLYCGIGTISLFLAKKAGKVCGVEIVQQAVEDARQNAKLNHIENAEFFCGAAEEVVPRIYEESAGALKADVVTLDPPRKGCDEKLLETVIRMEPGRIVYVSCDPATLARDLKYLCERGYELKRVRACEMFGFSGHVECVAGLYRR